MAKKEVFLLNQCRKNPIGQVGFISSQAANKNKFCFTLPAASGFSNIIK